MRRPNRVVRRLRNGLTVIFESMSMPIPVAGVALGIRGGSRDDPSDQWGSRHGLEHLMLRATEKHPSWSELSRYTRGFCRDLDGETDETNIVFFTETLPEYIGKVIRLLGEVITKPLFTEEQVQQEMSRLYEERAEERISDEDWLVETLDGYMFRSKGMGTPTQSFKRVADRFSLADLKQLYRESFVGRRLVLVVVGDFDLEAIEALVRRTFDRLERGLVLEPSVIDWQKLKGRIVLKRKPATEKVKFVIGFPTFGFGDRRRFVLSLIRHWLVTGNGSRFRIALDSVGYGRTFGKQALVLA